MSRTPLDAAGDAVNTAATALRRQLDARRGHHPDGDAGRTSRRAVTVLRPLEEVRAFCADPARLAALFDDVQRIDVVDEPDRIRWEATTAEGAASSGEARFAPAPADRGTEVRLELRAPAASAVGAVTAAASGTSPGQQLRVAAGRLKSLLETGEVLQVDGQPTGRSEGAERRTQLVDRLLRAAGRSS